MLDLNSFEQLAMSIKKRGTLKTVTISVGEIERKGLDKYTDGKMVLYIWYVQDYPIIEICFQPNKKYRMSCELNVRANPDTPPENGVYGRLVIYNNEYCPDKWSDFDTNFIVSDCYSDLRGHQVIDRVLGKD